MNDNDLKNNTQENNTYHATSNLNTAIENPQINMNSAVGVNIKSVASDNIANSNFVESQNDHYYNFDESSQFSNSNMSQVDSVNEFQSEITDNRNITEENESQFVPTYSVDLTTNTSDNEDAVYAPTMEQKKRHDKKFHISREFKVILFIAFILFIFVLIVPYIYDFFKQLELVITAR